MIETFHLTSGVTLRCFRDGRFKQGRISVQFVCPLRSQEAAMNALLPSVLIRGCQTAPDLRAITLRLDDLYGAAVGELVRKVGDYQTTGLTCSFIQDRYALEPEGVMGPMIAFLTELLTDPLRENGIFKEEFVESEKKNLIAAIEAKRNNKRSYASARMLEHMCREDSLGIPRLGTVAQVKAITAQSLWDHYQTLLSQSRIEIFYVGEQAPQQVAACMEKLFRPTDRKPLPEQTLFHSCGGGTFEETMDVAQSRLVMGWHTPISSRDPRFPVMQVCNVIFGGGMTSKLFTNVRERMSLCYDISSGFHGSKGILTAAAGIDSAKEPVVRQEILAQLDAICQGRITDKELAAAKNALCSGLRSIHDSPSAIEAYYASGVLSGCDLTPEAYRRAIEGVTAEEVAKAAQSLCLDTVYLLKGVQ